MGFRRHETHIPGLIIIEPDVFGDARGRFMEVYNRRSFEEIGMGEIEFVQDNLSTSTLGTIRGLHFQTPPYSQGKLVTVFEGRVLDVVVDLRTESPAFGKSFALELDAADPKMIWIPKGMAHGFQVLSESCTFFYKCNAGYHKAAEGGILWNDPALDIPWLELPSDPIVSEKDMALARFSEFESPF